MNDGLRTVAFMRYRAQVIACASLHLGTLKLGIPMPEWWTPFDVTTEEVESTATIIAEHYLRPRRYYEEMEVCSLNCLVQRNTLSH